MSKSYEIIERVGISNISISEAVQAVVSESHQQKPVSWFKIKEQRGRMTQDGKTEFQVIVEIGRQTS